MTNATISNVKRELNRLGWLASDSHPTLCCVNADDDLPAGWVRVSDDHCVLAIGNAAEIAEALRALDGDAEYGTGLESFGGKEPCSRDWPAELISFEQIGNGSVNDNPDTLITVATNCGIRFAAGPHGVSFCALEDCKNAGPLATTRMAAISQCVAG